MNAKAVLRKAAAFGLLWALSIASPSQAVEPADIGPFRFGMSFDEARAAAPRAKWTEQRSRYGGKVVELEAEKAFKLGGVNFDVGLKPLAYDGYQISVIHAEERASERRCMEVMSAVVRALESRFGALGPITPLSDADTGGLPLGFMGGSPNGDGDLVSVGQTSQIQTFRPQDTGTHLWLSGVRRDGLSVVIGGRYLDATSGLFPLTCVVAARLIAMPPRPDYEWLKIDSLPTPTIPSRRRSFVGLSRLPAEAARVDLVCEVHRQFGSVSRCRAAEGVDEALAKPAERQGDELRLDSALLDPDRDIPLRLSLGIWVDPADATVVALPAGVTALNRKEVLWAKWPNPEDMIRYFPERASRNGIGAAITLHCRIEADGALACLDETVRTVAGHEADFDGFSQRVAPLFRAEATLPDGQPSAGRWVTLGFNLVIPN